MTTSRLRWILWAWRVANATYIAGALTLLTGSSVIVFWTLLLFTPLLVVTLLQTRSKLIAAVGIPLIGAALLSAVHLWNSIAISRQVPPSTLFQVIWFAGVLGPFILYVVVSRYVAAELQRLAGASNPR